MDRMTSISTFVKIAEPGGFAAAARKLGVSSTVSTQIQDLEDRLGVGLLNRSTRKVSLTESSYRHIEAPANGVAEGEPQAGAYVDIKRAAELAPEEIARKSHYKFDHAEPIAKVEGLAAYDAIIIGASTRSGRLPSRMVNFLEAGGLWARGALQSKVGGAFTSTATQHGEQETTLFSIITNLLHFGMVIVGLDYGHAGQRTLDEIAGASPCGATIDRGRRRFAPADPERAPGSALPGPEDCGDRKQAARLMVFSGGTDLRDNEPMEMHMSTSPNFATGRLPCRTRFVLVNDRVPRTDQRCALCSRIVDKGYVRDSQTRFIYCDTRCLLGGSRMTMSPLKGRSRKVS
jgi:NAD(P)H dehydrogenase (quinone)